MLFLLFFVVIAFVCACVSACKQMVYIYTFPLLPFFVYMNVLLCTLFACLLSLRLSIASSYRDVLGPSPSPLFSLLHPSLTHLSPFSLFLALWPILLMLLPTPSLPDSLIFHFHTYYAFLHGPVPSSLHFPSSSSSPTTATALSIPPVSCPSFL